MSDQSQDPANMDYVQGMGGIGHELGTSGLDTGRHDTDGLGTGTGTGGLGMGGLCPNVTGTH